MQDPTIAGSPPRNTPRRPLRVYDPVNRHALVMGGANQNGDFPLDIWRIPLGDGPAVSLERWDFPRSAAEPTHIAWPVSAVHGDGKRTLVGTEAGGAYVYESDTERIWFSPSYLRSGQVNGVYYDAERNTSWFATDAGVTGITHSSATTAARRTAQGLYDLQVKVLQDTQMRPNGTWPKSDQPPILVTHRDECRD